MGKLSILGIKKHIETHRSWPTTSHFHHLSSHTKRHDVSCGQIQGRLQNCNFVLKPNTSMRVVSLLKLPCAFYRGNMAYSCRLSITFIHHIEAFQLHRKAERTPRNERAENLKKPALGLGKPNGFSIHPLSKAGYLWGWGDTGYVRGSWLISHKWVSFLPTQTPPPPTTIWSIQEWF